MSILQGNTVFPQKSLGSFYRIYPFFILYRGEFLVSFYFEGQTTLHKADHIQHECFKFIAIGFFRGSRKLLFDWDGSEPVPELGETPACIFVSHGHEDHYSKKIYSLREKSPQTVLLLSDDISAKKSALSIAPAASERRENRAVVGYSLGGLGTLYLFLETGEFAGRGNSDDILKLRAVLESIGKIYGYNHLESLFINTDIPPREQHRKAG